MCVTIARAAANPIPAQAGTTQAESWYRGNTHAHTLNSDGNATPLEVARWYRDNGYAFVVITDHERITDVSELNRELGVAGRFIILSGQEITQRVADPSRPSVRQAHVNAIGVRRAILPIGDRAVAIGLSVAATFARNIAEVLAAGGLAQVNHPNFGWSIRPDDMGQLPDSTLFEVWNGQPRINNLGGDDGAGSKSLSTEALWDTLLTRGKLLYGVASDDAHKFLPAQLHDPDATRPGSGWVMVRAEDLTPESIISAMRSGQFYSSTGIFLDEYDVSQGEIGLRIARADARDDRRFRTRFIGRGGVVLADIAGTNPRYSIRGNEGYVRAAVTDSNGRRAWTQPILVPRR